MSTGNFHYKNVLFPVLMSTQERFCHECQLEADDGEACGGCGEEVESTTRYPDSLEVDDFIKSVQEALQSSAVAFQAESGWHNGDRLLGTFDIKSNPYSNFVYARIYVTLNGGYYDGACLDYDIDYLYEEGQKRAWLDRFVMAKAWKITQIFRRFAREYEVAYRASNGETGYRINTTKKDE